VSGRKLAAAAEAAADASGYARKLSEAADRIDPYVPLADYLRPVFGLYQAADFLGNCLYYAAPLASDALLLEAAGCEPAEAVAVHKRLADSCRRTGRVSDTVQRARAALLRDLGSVGTEPGPETADAELLARRASQARDCLAALQTALMHAGKVTALDEPLAALTGASAAVTHLALAAAYTGQACDRFAYGLREAYERHPAGQRGTRPRPPLLLRTAASMMQRTAADTRRAERSLDTAAERARKAARQAAG